MFGKAKGLLESTSKLFFEVVGGLGTLLKEIFSLPPGGKESGGGTPFSIKSSIVGKEGGG